MSIASSSTTAIRAAKVASVVLSATAAGGVLGISTFLVPRLLESPTGLMLRQWQRMFDAGKIVFPSAAGTSALAFAYVYYAGKTRLSRGPLVAAGLCLAIVPYTLLVLLPTNKKLAAKAAAAEADAQLSKAERAAGGGLVYTAEEELSAKQLVDRWATLSLGRPALLAAAAIVGLVSYL